MAIPYGYHEFGEFRKKIRENSKNVIMNKMCKILHTRVIILLFFLIFHQDTQLKNSHSYWLIESHWGCFKLTYLGTRNITQNKIQKNNNKKCQQNLFKKQHLQKLMLGEIKKKTVIKKFKVIIKSLVVSNNCAKQKISPETYLKRWW